MPKIFRPFESAMNFVWDWEGGFTDDPDDPGRATNYGITLNTAIENGMDINGDGKVDALDIKEMTPEAAIAVYKNKFWSPLFHAFPNLSWDIAIAAFDTAVNCGPARALSWLQRAMTKDNPVQHLLELRMIHYQTISQKNPALKKYLKCWTNRVADLKKFIEHTRIDIADGVIGSPPELS